MTTVVLGGLRRSFAAMPAVKKRLLLVAIACAAGLLPLGAAAPVQYRFVYARRVMPLPWLRIIDALIGVTTLVRNRTWRAHSDKSERLAAGRGTLGRLEMRLVGIIVAALKEAFDRDSRRLELEREQIEAERQRAERALRLELLRQAGDREIARLRLVAGVAVASWLGSTLFFSARVIGGSLGARAALAAAWASLLAALALAFLAQSRIVNALARIADAVNVRPDELSAGISGTIAPWLIVFGLALIAVGVLVV